MTDYRYYMFNKPAGCITAKKDPKHKVVMDYFLEEEWETLNPVGRLDIDTEGLLFVTDDGKWNNMLMQPSSHIKKTYFFLALGAIDEQGIKSLENGVSLIGSRKKSEPAVITVLDEGVLSEIPDYAKGKRYDIIKNNRPETPIVSGRITICEGKKRQVKRMLKAIGCYCIYLKREAIGNVKLDENLKPGQYRKLSMEERRSLL